MAHKEQRDFCFRVKNIYPDFFKNKKVLDIGSLDVNGNSKVSGFGSFGCVSLSNVNPGSVILGDSTNAITLPAGGGKGLNGASSNNYPVSCYEAYGWNFTIQNSDAGQFGLLS